MDPKQALIDMKAALMAKDFDAFTDANRAYCEWRRRGGFEPKVTVITQNDPIETIVVKGDEMASHLRNNRARKAKDMPAIVTWEWAR